MKRWMICIGLALLAGAGQAETYEPELATILALGSLTNAPALYDSGNAATTWTAVSAAAVASGEAQPVYYDGLDYNGNPTRIFAWVGLPSDLSSSVPAMVLAHGGGGTAYKTWVDKWTAQGYAAIAMDLEGRVSSATGVTSVNANAGPVRDGIYENSQTYPSTALTNHWMYHAVADCVLANSLMRSMPEVNADQVGIMGVSWGGVVTSTTIGIDTRFMFAIPTYGCGHLYDDYNQYADALADCEFYKQVWDPMVRIHRATMPALWFSWPQDQHFALDCQAANYFGAPGERMVSLIPNLGHSHTKAWNPGDSYAFAESMISAGSPWCRQQSLALSNGTATVTFSSTRTLDEAVLVSTTGTGFTGDLTWNEAAAALVNNGDGSWTSTAELPTGTTAWFINVLDGSLVASSDYQEIISLILDPSDELDHFHLLGSTQSTGTVEMAFTAPTNVEISGIHLSGQSHPGAFTNLTAGPMVQTNAYPATTPVEILFDNTAAGLTNGETATATLTIVWDELDGTTDQIELAIKATAGDTAPDPEPEPEPDPILLDNDFGEEADTGPALQGLGDSTADPATGSMATGTKEARYAALNNSTALDVTSVSGAIGFRIDWTVSSATANYSYNGLFFGATDAPGTAGFGAQNAFGLFVLSPIRGNMTIGEKDAGSATFTAAGVADPTAASLLDGFSISLTVSNDNTWSVSTTGLSTDLNTSGTLGALSYEDIAANLAATAFIQGYSQSLTLDHVTVTALFDETEQPVISITNGTTLVWNTDDVLSYEVQVRTNLTDGDWITYTNIIGTPPVTSFAIPLDEADAQFFQIVFP